MDTLSIIDPTTTAPLPLTVPLCPSCYVYGHCFGHPARLTGYAGDCRCDCHARHAAAQVMRTAVKATMRGMEG